MLCSFLMFLVVCLWNEDFNNDPQKHPALPKRARKVQHIPICRYNHGADLFRLRPVWDDDTEWEAALQKAGGIVL